MCGIAGLYGIPADADVLPRMLDAIAHRGPDAEGVHEIVSHGADVRLGHRRLSIIDLSEAANQPLEKDGLIIVYNGELYNYKELGAELRAAGVRFRTTSDTEVVLEAWRKWGADCLNRFRGMFAFAMLDTRTGRLVLARDPFGIKPLFIARRNGGLVFASELKAIATALGTDLKVNATALISSLMYYWIPEGHCVYEGVQKLPPGYWAEISPNGDYRERCYYDPQRELIHDSYEEISVDRLRTIIEESVEAHMVADVPVSAFLSGGLDSSLITAIAARQGHNVEGYTISFREEDQKLEAMPDDLFYARKIAKAYDLKLHEIEIAPDVADMLPKVVDMLDEPIGDAAAINAYLICKAARDTGTKSCCPVWALTSCSAATASISPACWPRNTGRFRASCGRAWCVRPSIGCRWRIRIAASVPSAGRNASSPSPTCPRKPHSGAAIRITACPNSTNS